MRLNRAAVRDLEWWSNLPQERKTLYSRPFIRPSPVERVWYDASRSGFGVVLEETEWRKEEKIVAGKWTSAQKQEHITALEARAGYYALETYVKHSHRLSGERNRDVAIELVGDSFAVVTAFEKQTSPSHDVMRSIRKLSNLQLTQGLWVQHAWIPTSENKADWPSRLRLEESYKFRFAMRLADEWGVDLQIDRFASYFNRQVKRYNSLLRSPDSEGNAWEALWSQDGQFFNPPFSQIGRVLQKMVAERAGGILIVPRWTMKDWYPLLDRLTIHRRRLYRNVSLYMNEAGEMLPSPAWGTWALRILPR